MRLLGATQPFLTFDSATVALGLGLLTRAIVAMSTKIHDRTARSIVAGVLLVVGSLTVYATNAVGDIALWPDLVIVAAIASALVIGVDRTVIGQVFEFLDKTFPAFWKAGPNSVGDPNSIGIGRDPVKLYAKQAAKLGENASSHPTEGGVTGDPLLDALGPPDVDPSHLTPPAQQGEGPLAPPPE